MGAEMWARTWANSGTVSVDTETLLTLCELTDERVALRVKVLRDPDNWRERNALRALDQQVLTGLSSLGIASARSIPTEWPDATLQWWDILIHMPHCVLWDDSDWQFALETALLAATFHAGDARVANELRQREKIMGTTMDARRDLRIRYVDSVEENADPAIVTAMESYRRVATGQ
jgi:hypothetical protein